MQEHKVIDFSLGRLSPEESLRVLDLIERDEHLSDQLELANDLVNLSANYPEVLFANRRTARQNRRISLKVPRLLTHSKTLRILSRGVEIAMLGITMFSLMAYLTRNPYASLANTGRGIIVERVRGIEEQELISATSEFEAGRLHESISQFERFLRRHPKSPNADAVRISIALEYFTLSRNTLMFFPSYDPAYVRVGLEQLEAVALSPENERLREEATWLLANGYLMVGNEAQAVARLDAVVAMNGVHSFEASRLLERIRNLID